MVKRLSGKSRPIYTERLFWGCFVAVAIFGTIVVWSLTK